MHRIKIPLANANKLIYFGAIFTIGSGERDTGDSTVRSGLGPHKVYDKWRAEPDSPASPRWNNDA